MLQEMHDEGIIEEVEGATQWLSPLVPVPKKNEDVRLVLDIRVSNTALVRRCVQIPKVMKICNKCKELKFLWKSIYHKDICN